MPSYRLKGRAAFDRRGLVVHGEGRDIHGNHFRVQSSSAVQVGAAPGPFVWLFLDGQIVGTHLGKPMTAALHMTAVTARQLEDALAAWRVAQEDTCG
jgi:hypothetical protein